MVIVIFHFPLNLYILFLSVGFLALTLSYSPKLKLFALTPANHPIQ